jgi:hypothetical protein
MEDAQKIIAEMEKLGNTAVKVPFEVNEKISSARRSAPRPLV